MKTNNESWTKKGAVIGSQDDCAKEMLKEYNKVGPEFCWQSVVDEDRFDSAEIANKAIEKMMKVK